MKISNIVIENFRGIDKGSYDLKNLTIFLGKTGAGKSSVLDALIFALTGDVDVDDIRHGATDTAVCVTFEDGSTIERIRDKSGTTVKVNGKRSTVTSANEYITSITGSDVSFLPAFMGIDFFESVSQKDLTDFFSKILPCSISFDKMIELIKEKRDVTDEDVAFLKKYFPDGNYGLETIDSVYKEVFEERKTEKTVLKNLLPKTEFSGVTPTESREYLEKELFEIAKKEAEVSSFEKALTAYNNACKTKEDAEKKRAEITEALKAYADAKKPSEDVLIKAKEDRKKFVDAIEKSRSLKATAEANIKSFQSILDNLASDRCVACKDIVCTTDKSCAKADLEGRIKHNEKIAVEHNVFIKRCEEQIVMRDNAIEDYNKEVLEYTKKESLEKQLTNIVIPELPEKPAQTTSIDYTTKKTEINNKLSILSQLEAVKKNKKEADEVAKKVKLLEMAVAALDVKTGVRTVILQRALSTLEALCNQKIAMIDTNMSVQFKADAGIEVFVKTKNSKGFIPMKKASTGQFVLVAFSLMCLIGKVTNCKYAVIDNLDKFDRDTAKAFLNLINNDDTFENVVLAGVSHDDLVEECKNYNCICL